MWQLGSDWCAEHLGVNLIDLLRLKDDPDCAWLLDKHILLVKQYLKILHETTLLSANTLVTLAQTAILARHLLSATTRSFSCRVNMRNALKANDLNYQKSGKTNSKEFVIKGFKERKFVLIARSMKQIGRAHV